MPRKRKERESLHSWLAVFFTAAGLMITLWTTMSDRADSKKKRALENVEQLTAAEEKVSEMMKLHLTMERAVQQCIRGGTDEQTCWMKDYDFKPEAASAAWKEFDVAVFAAHTEASTKREIETVARLERIRRQYRFDPTDTAQAMDCILRTSADLDAAIEEFKGAVLASIT